MPIAPAAKGIIIVSGILVAASIALYENEHVREWIENTGRKISGAWDDIVNFDQRQRQRRAMPQGYVMGEAQEMGSRSVQERRDARRRLYEAAGERQGLGVSEEQARSTTAVNENVDSDGLRKRRVRGEESQEHLLGQVQGQHDMENPNVVIFDQAEDPAISVPELLPEVAESAADGQTTSGSHSLQSSSFFSTKGSQENVSASTPTLIDYEMPASLAQDEPSYQVIPQFPQTELLLGETLSPTPPTAASHPQDSETTTQATAHSPSNLSTTTTTATEPLTLTIPLTPHSRTSTPSPVQVHTPTSASSSSFSSPTSYGAGIHTPSHFDDDDFDALSDAGTETASQVSEWREEQRDRLREDDVVSVASEESGWSEVGADEQRMR